MDAPFFTVVVPVRNGGEAFHDCLAALYASAFTDWELVVVDDGSHDQSSDFALAMGVFVLPTRGGVGPAAARNLGAEAARGEFLFFLDADCRVHEDTLGRAAAHLRDDPGLDALFGSYDAAPAEPSFVSQYKNLLHHWTHQRSGGNAGTFWAGCGAVRRERFAALGGFDVARYPRPSVEDIELGLRLKAAGGRIRLTPDVQVTHLKRWTLGSLLLSDLRDRALPWTRLIVERRRLPRSLNLGWIGRLSGLLAVAAPILAALGRWLPAGLALLALLLLNAPFYLFLLRKRGLWFVLRAIPLHALYYFYSALTFAVGIIAALLRR